VNLFSIVTLEFRCNHLYPEAKWIHDIQSNINCPSDTFLMIWTGHRMVNCLWHDSVVIVTGILLSFVLVNVVSPSKTDGLSTYDS